MLLKSIKLENFRQFRNESIEFAQGEDGKNVTIIFGDNGTGKTTFAQAFFWCLYGETDFSDKFMLNIKVGDGLKPNQTEKVKVTLELKHGEVNYTLEREQSYKKDHTNKIKAENTVFNIDVKDSSGNISQIRKTACESEVQKILPKELSHYFFFDGERIGNMSKEISNGKKSTGFAEAVKGLLGLNAMISAIQHFNPNSRYGVIGSYENSFDSKSNSKILEYTQVIDNCKAKITNIETRLEELDEQITSATNRKMDKTEEIKQYKEGEKLQEDKEQFQLKIENAKRNRANVYKAICKEFNGKLSPFLSISLMKRAMEIVSQGDFSGKDIPAINAKTIEYLLKQKVCICGTHLDEGSVPCNKVKELIEYLPPQSISTTISDFKKEVKHRVGQNQDIYSVIKNNMAIISEQNDDINDFTEELQNIESQLSGGDVRAKVRAINNEIQICTDTIRKCNVERDTLNQSLGGINQELEHADTERRNLTLLDDQNKQIEIYKAYAERIFKELQEEYSSNEKYIRDKLQNNINDIFKEIYKGGLTLSIDSKYHISVSVEEYEDNIETSTAQSISVIFAFITGIMKIARENRSGSDERTKLLSSEPYPLVMDAPLSTLDKRRIKTVCEVLPKTAEQVIIFTKDTDGMLAEEYMGDRIGKSYVFEKKNECETVLNRRSSDV